MKPLLRLPFLLAVACDSIRSPAATGAPRFNHAAYYLVDLKISFDLYREIVACR